VYDGPYLIITFMDVDSRFCSTIYKDLEADNKKSVNYIYTLTKKRIIDIISGSLDSRIRSINKKNKKHKKEKRRIRRTIGIVHKIL